MISPRLIKNVKYFDFRAGVREGGILSARETDPPFILAVTTIPGLDYVHSNILELPQCYVSYRFPVTCILTSQRSKILPMSPL